MKRFVLALILTSPLFLPMKGDCQSAKQVEARRCYERGVELRAQGRSKEAVTELRRAVSLHRKFADAYYQLALALMDIGTLDCRFEANDALDKALRLDPKNVEYHYTMGLLCLRRDMAWEAARHFKKVLKLDPEYAWAYFQLGRLKEEDMMKYKDMIDNSDPDGIIFFQGFANDDLKKAIDYYEKAIDSNPHFTEAFYRLGLLCYELGDYAQMANILKRALATNPADKNVHLFLGLCYQKLGEYPLAFHEYERARWLMGDEERKLFESVELVMSPQEEKQYRSASDTGKAKVRLAFWKSRDPLFLTEYNERLLEHYGRVAYANLRFSDPNRRLEGWRTDRGKVLIRYGEPQFKYRTRPWVDVSFGGGNPLHASVETWKYGDMVFRFEDRFLSGNYEFKWGFYPEEDGKYFYDMLVKQRPERYEYRPPKPPLHLAQAIGDFRGKDGLSAVDVFYGLPAKEVAHATFGDSMKVTLREGLFFFDENWKDVAKQVDEKHRRFATPLDTTRQKLLLEGSEVQVPPGRYHFALEIEDQLSGRVALYHDTLAVDRYGANEVQMSDIVLASGLLENPGPTMANGEETDRRPSWNGRPEESHSGSVSRLRLVPNFAKAFHPGEPLYVYYEIYNLGGDSTGVTRFRIDNTLRPLKKGPSAMLKALRRVGQWIGLTGQRENQVATSYESSGVSETEVQYQAMQVQADGPGEFELGIRVTDVHTHHSAEKGARVKAIGKRQGQ